MRKFSARPSISAIIFYLFLLVLWVIILVNAGKDYWYTGLAPWYGLGLIFLISGSHYRIERDQIIVRNPFERKSIPLNAIDNIEEIRNPLWKRTLTGFPAFSIRITHNQQQTLLHTNNQEVLHSMMASVNPSV